MSLERLPAVEHMAARSSWHCRATMSYCPQDCPYSPSHHDLKAAISIQVSDSHAVVELCGVAVVVRREQLVGDGGEHGLTALGALTEPGQGQQAQRQHPRHLRQTCSHSALLVAPPRSHSTEPAHHPCTSYSSSTTHHPPHSVMHNPSILQPQDLRHFCAAPTCLSFPILPSLFLLGTMGGGGVVCTGLQPWKGDRRLGGEAQLTWTAEDCGCQLCWQGCRALELALTRL